MPGSKNRGIFGPVKLHGYIDNSFALRIEMYLKQGGEYRLMPFKIQNDHICDAYNGDSYFMPKIAAASNFTMPLPCPMSNVKISQKIFCYRTKYLKFYFPDNIHG